MPEWLERLKTDYYRSRMSRTQLDEIHDCAVKAAIKDQELAGIDIVSDGELRRDNDVDYLLARMPGIEIPVTSKDFYHDYYDARVATHPGAAGPAGDRPGLGLDDDFASPAPGPTSRSSSRSPARSRCPAASWTSATSRPGRPGAGPGPRARRRRRGPCATPARTCCRSTSRSSPATPSRSGSPWRRSTSSPATWTSTWALHVCYGNRYARPLWEGHYDFLFPAVLDARVDQLVLEFARKGYEDLPVIERSGWDRAIGLGVIDVKSRNVETPDLVSARIERALELVPADRLIINPDCGLRNLPTAIATAKLRAMVEGAAKVRAQLSATS